MLTSLLLSVTVLLSGVLVRFLAADPLPGPCIDDRCGRWLRPADTAVPASAEDFSCRRRLKLLTHAFRAQLAGRPTTLRMILGTRLHTWVSSSSYYLQTFFMRALIALSLLSSRQSSVHRSVVDL